MKKVHYSKLAVLLSLVVVLGSCSGLKKMQEQAGTTKFEVAPKVLEMHNNVVNATFTGKFPPKYFNKKAVVTVTPVLKYEGGQVELKSFVLQGEQVQANDKVIPFEAGGDFSYSDSLVYKDEMMLSKVDIKVSAKIKKDTMLIGTFTVGDGIIVTPKLVRKEPKTVELLQNSFVRNIAENKLADIKYLINQSEVRNAELKKDEIKQLNDYVKAIAQNPKFNIKGIELSSYASPDGPENKNAELADKRESAAVKYFKSELKKAKLDKIVKDSLFSMLKTPEDWDGFKASMEKSDVKDKDLILRVLSMYSDPAVREKEIRNISEAFDELKTKILPELRRSKLTVSAEAIGFSDEELISLADSKPDTLSLEEVIYTANMIQDLDKKAALYTKAAEKYPNDVRVKNNLGYVLFKQGKIDEAKAALEQAKSIENNDAVKTNLGAVALVKGDLTAAEELFTSALGAGAAPNYNLGIISIINGKYEKAVGYFGNECDANTALAKLLNKNYEAAQNAMGCSKDESAQGYYLRAVIGARMDNSDLVLNNLRAAVGKDIQLKNYAKKDVEFLKYFNDETFKSIIQ